MNGVTLEVDMCFARLVTRCDVFHTVMHSCGTCTNLVTSFWWFRQRVFLCKSKLGVRFFGRWERVNVGFEWTAQKGLALDVEVSHWR